MNEFYKTFSHNWNLTTPNKKTSERRFNKLFFFINTIKDLLKCEICKNYYDLFTHSPFIIKSGQTFCKDCIINNSNFISNKDIEQYYIPNSLINLIIKEFHKFNSENYSLNLEDKKTKSYKKFDMKNGIFNFDEPLNINIKNSESKERKLSLLNIINSNNKYDMNKTKLNYKNKNNINFNSNNNIINLNSINVNIETIESKKDDKINENKINLFKFNNIENIDDNDIDNEIKLDEKCDFGFDMISESIDTIPLFEDKSMTNMSFKKECDEILNKNNEANQKSSEKNKIKKMDNNDNKNNLLNIQNNIHSNENKEQILDNINISFNLMNKNNDISFGPKSKNIINYDIENKSNKKENKEEFVNENIDNNKIKSKHKFLFFDGNKNNEINKKKYLNHNNKSKSLFNINKKELYIENDKIINNPNVANIKENIIFTRKKNIYMNNKDMTNQNKNILTTKRIKPKLFTNENIKNIENEENNKGCETSRIPPSKSMNLNNFHEKCNSIDKNININNEIKNKEKKNNLNLNKLKKDSHMVKKIQKKTIISRNVTLDLDKKEQYKTIQDEKNSAITYNKKFIISSKISSLNNNYEDKNNSKEYFNTINSSQKIKNNKLNSFQTPSIIFSKKKKIIQFQNQNQNEKKISINNSKKTIFKNENIIQRIPRLALKDIKDTSPFNISPMNSSRYNSKNRIDMNSPNLTKPEEISVNTNNSNMFRTNKNSVKNLNIKIKNNINYNSSLKSIIKNEFDDINSNFNLVKLKEITINKMNIVDKTTEKLKNDFERIFSNNKRDFELPSKILKNKNTYYEIFKNFIKQLKNEKEYPKMIIKFIEEDFFIGILDGHNLPKKGGIYTSKGESYIGEFINGKKEGSGTIIYSNGTKYEGNFKNDKHEGFGKLWQLDGEMFVGEWKEGKINGNGMRFHSNGDKYIGNYINNIRNGQGHYIFSNGDSYEGNWTNGYANGFGKFNFKNGNCYEGNFKQNIIYGKGAFNMNNGDIYIGFFKSGLINGIGTYYNKKGEKYIGNFINGKKNGFGKLYDKNGKIILSGIWKEDNFIM